MKNPFYKLKNKLLRLNMKRQQKNAETESLYATQEDLKEAIATMEGSTLDNQSSVTKPAISDKESIITGLKRGFQRNLSDSFANVALTNAVNAELKTMNKQTSMAQIESRLPEIQRNAFQSLIDTNHIPEQVHFIQVHPSYFVNFFAEKLKEMQSPELDKLLREQVSIQCHVDFILFADNSLISKIQITDKQFQTILLEWVKINQPKMMAFIEQNNDRVNKLYEKQQISDSEEKKQALQQTDMMYRMSFASLVQSILNNQFVNIDDTKIYCNYFTPENTSIENLLLSLKNPEDYPLLTAQLTNYKDA